LDACIVKVFPQLPQFEILWWSSQLRCWWIEGNEGWLLAWRCGSSGDRYAS